MSFLNEDGFVSIKCEDEELIISKNDYKRLDEALITERYILVLKFTEKYGESFLLSHVKDHLQSVPSYQREDYLNETKKLVEKYNGYLKIVAHKNK